MSHHKTDHYIIDQFKANKIKDHNCTLPLKDDPIAKTIYEGVCVNFRRKLRSIFVVSPENPESKMFYRSSAQIIAEQQRHMTSHFHMIHPMSEFRMYWENTMIGIYIFQLLILPLDMAIPIPSTYFLVVKTLSDLVVIVDMILTIFTGRINRIKHKVEYKKGIIIKHYLLTYFLCDLLPCTPFSFVIYLKETLAENYSFLLAKLVYALRIFRLKTYNAYIKKLAYRRHWSCYKVQVLTSISRFLVTLLWLASFRYIIFENLHVEEENQQAWDEYVKSRPNFHMEYLNHVYRSVKALCLAEFQTVYTLDNYKFMSGICHIALGVILDLILIAEMYQIYVQKMASKCKYETSMKQLSAFTRYKGLNVALDRRIHDYVEFKYQKTIVRENEFLATLSLPRRQEINLHNSEIFMRQIEVFSIFSPQAVQDILKKLRKEIYLPGDVICYAGSPGNAMYFILIGTVAVYLKDNTEIAHFEDGSYFGELSLMTNSPRPITTVAIKACEVLRLAKRDFIEIIEHHPDFLLSLKEHSTNRLQMYGLNMDNFGNVDPMLLARKSKIKFANMNKFKYN